MCDVTVDSRPRANSLSVSTGSYLLALSQVQKNLQYKEKAAGLLTERYNKNNFEKSGNNTNNNKSQNKSLATSLPAPLIPSLTLERHLKNRDKLDEVRDRLINLYEVYPKIKQLQKRAIAQYHSIATHLDCIVCPNCKRMLSRRAYTLEQMALNQHVNPHIKSVHPVEKSIDYTCHYRTYDQRFISRNKNKNKIRNRSATTYS